MRMGAFTRELVRTVTRKPGRFLALLAIVALGAGFYAGLLMTSPDMKMALDEHFDGNDVYDIRLVGTMGLDEDDAEALRALEGVDQVMMAYETDVLASLKQTSYTTRVHSIPDYVLEAQASGKDVEGPYLNRLELDEGRWPAAPDECLICADRVNGADAHVGDVLVVTQGATDLSSTLTARTFTVVGTVHAPYYVSTANLDSSSLGSGVVQQVIYVGEDAFADAYPYTEAFLSVAAAKPAFYGTDAYDEAVAAVRAQLDAIAETRCEERLEHVTRDLLLHATTYDGLVDLAEYVLGHTQAEIEDPAKPEWLILGREKNAGTLSFTNDSDRIANIATVFPFMFFLVAALVALTTMTRMVDEERILAGTYKALGYSKARIASKYLIYAAVASATGSLVGILVLSKLLPGVILNAYAIMYRVPAKSFPIDVPIAVGSAALFMAITLLATWFSIAVTLREKPAALLLPKVVASGKRIALERIAPLWKALSFTWKVTFRNIFRYKKRFIMTVAGIAGCTALLLTGFGLHDAINDIIDVQYGELVHHNAVVSIDSKIGAGQKSELFSVMDDTSYVEGYTQAYSETMLASGPRNQDKRIDIVVPADPEAFSQMKTLRTRVGHHPVTLSPGTVALNEKLAGELGIRVGDTITMAKQDAMGNATSETYEFEVTNLVENYIYNYLYMDAETFEAVTGDEPPVTALYANVSTDTSVRQALDERLGGIRGVKTLSFNDETIDTYRRMLRSVDLIVVVLIVAAALLAFIVLYNLTNINIEERTREIATLKVLGFTRRETAAYIFREIAILAVVGCLIGLFLGVFLESFVVTTAEVDQVMFGRAIHPASYVFSGVLTLVFSACSMALMLPKLAHIDMVMSLKSNE